MIEPAITDLEKNTSHAIALSELGLHLDFNDGALTHLQASLNGTSKSESSSNYFRTIAHLNSDWRLILCKTGIQWILQKRRGQSKWEGRWFVRTKQGLLRGLSDPVLDIEGYGEVNEAALRRIHELPERCEG